MAGYSEKDQDYYIRNFDGTNFTIWKWRMMDVLVNKELAAPLKDRKERVYNDDQWKKLDARARATICLHLGESIFFTIMDKTTAFELWDSLCSAWDDKSASNKVFLMKKLMRLSMKEGSSVSSHLNEFNALYSQLTSKGLNFDDEMKAIFLLCSLPASWDTFNTAISNSTHGGKLTFGEVTSALLTEEIRHQSLDSGGHGDEITAQNQLHGPDLEAGHVVTEGGPGLIAGLVKKMLVLLWKLRSVLAVAAGVVAAAADISSNLEWRWMPKIPPI
ncbi:hypothetical protein L7F22_014454 [Adiantum nelumboides]|nr:hypothetical protein [Adiantum nelumboides]